jgi:malonyl CoA-acyl carrier protein transacylase
MSATKTSTIDRLGHDAAAGIAIVWRGLSHACLFPGQGSQAKGMGAALFDRFADWTADADAVLGYSIRELCVDDPRSELGLTSFTQPALFVVNAMTFRARLEDGAALPAFVAGHSLGEYNALLAAGVFDFKTGVALVKRRGALMGQVSGGGMAAVIGLAPDRIQAVLHASAEGSRLDVANFNSFDQTVIAGPKDAITAVKPEFEAAGVRAFIPLKVSAPFHSRYMQGPQDEFADFLASFSFGAPAVPVVANATAACYEPDRMRQTLASQIGSPVRWLDSMLFLLDQGVTDFVETGPGSVLTKLIAQIRKSHMKA